MSTHLNPGELFRWYPAGNKALPLIQEREVAWLLGLHAQPLRARPDVPACQCLTCLQGRRWWKDRHGVEFQLSDSPAATYAPTLVGEQEAPVLR